MPLPFHLVDAFSDGPFTGNPAAVVPLDGPRPDAWLQSVAMEMNQAETAFLLPEGDVYRLRWFTPTIEVDLCGHATLAAASVLGLDRVVFLTRSGELTVARDGDGDGWAMDFPAEPYAFDIFDAPGHDAVWTGRNRMDRVAVMETVEEVIDYVPDFRAIAELGGRGFIVTAPGGGADYVARCFFPQSGIDEDSVTGSAHAALAPYWGERLGLTELTGRQASRRGGTVRTTLKGDRVVLWGRAILTAQGTLLC